MILHVYFLFCTLAVITAVPFALAVTFPLLLTTAIFLFEELHTIFTLVPVSFNCTVFPFIKVAFVLFILVFVAALTTCNCPGKVEEAIGVIPAMSISIIINLKVDLILIFSFILSLLVLFIISLEMFISLIIPGLSEPPVRTLSPGIITCRQKFLSFINLLAKALRLLFI